MRDPRTDEFINQNNDRLRYGADIVEPPTMSQFDDVPLLSVFLMGYRRTETWSERKKEEKLKKFIRQCLRSTMSHYFLLFSWDIVKLRHSQTISSFSSLRQCLRSTMSHVLSSIFLDSSVYLLETPLKERKTLF